MFYVSSKQWIYSVLSNYICINQNLLIGLWRPWDLSLGYGTLSSTVSRIFVLLHFFWFKNVLLISQGNYILIISSYHCNSQDSWLQEHNPNQTDLRVCKINKRGGIQDWPSLGSISTIHCFLRLCLLHISNSSEDWLLLYSKMAVVHLSSVSSWLGKVYIYQNCEQSFYVSLWLDHTFLS